ncbi:dolichyl-phosphate-mannose--protein mannosyltransferase [Amycolatopsis anabasis]|uniref:dolichyl-phosphate-mannose--protein mannosyltransferase n=1 Tax=Amycolatopsis anabasis TaxID=1840409 RepID=UPI00131CF928|nr:phospholipid carrier-dependent glycosyltransferase [Amycolatopsis anabasis]
MGTGVDLERSRLLRGQQLPGDKLRSWVVTLVLTVVGGFVRLRDLGYATDGGTPIFDEKYYARQAWEMLRNGGYEDNPGYRYIVHPPLGKQFIALGEWLFGYQPVGWRIAAAIAGTLTILLIIRIARRLTGSTFLGAVAGILLICDGFSHVQSRIGMLDAFLAPLILGAFGCLLADRAQVRNRLAEAVERGWLTSPWGPRLGVRWWRAGAGVCLGLACGVKWSGLWFVLALGILSVLFDATARRTAGVDRPWLGTLRRDVAPALWALVLIPIGVYLATWWAWFASETGIDRHAAETEYAVAHTLTFVPGALRSLAYNAIKVLDFHESLATPAGDPHPWESKPWTWPMGLRPMLYSYDAHQTGCSGCVRATMLIGTPALWWLALPVLGWGLWRAVFRLDWRYAAVLTVYLGGLLPWFTNLDRQMYFFYMTPVAAFLVLGVVLVLGQVLGAAKAGFERRGTGLLAVSCYIGLVVANFAWLWPVLNAVPITNDHWQAELWLPSWR